MTTGHNMATHFFFTNRNAAEDVIHVGDAGTLVGFRSDPGIATVLAEMRKRDGQAALAMELSNAEFDAKKLELGIL